ncbi:hypothetical protein HOLleu_09039 [Holothuria leucospilota]|uniref:Uncharacterized protein n=1 Tax=Holothuria leucospilota TaxID=206669 RepID=A0A9Q1CJM3_HOLLE|nr:hypothetical protein HOLleu_09039 [Holothuria leucospilota]
MLSTSVASVSDNTLKILAFRSWIKLTTAIACLIMSPFRVMLHGYTGLHRTSDVHQACIVGSTSFQDMSEKMAKMRQTPRCWKTVLL